MHPKKLNLVRGNTVIFDTNLDPLWRIIGYSRALEVSFTGRIYDVQEAYAMGFVSKIFETGELLEGVNKIATDVSSYDRKLLVETKQLGQQLLNSSLNIQ